MAVKEDKFWEEHEPVYSESEALREKAGVPGIVAEEVSDWKRWGPSLVLTIPLIYFGIVATVRSGAERVEALFAFSMLYPIGMLLDFVLQSVVRRYRLVEDECWVELSPLPFWRPHALVEHVVGTPALYARLAPPRVGEPPIYFHPDFRAVGYWFVVPFYVLATCYALLGVVLHANLLAALCLAVIFLHVYRAWHLRVRVKAGLRVFGTGQEENADETPVRRFEAVQRAELRWDALLQQSYLLLGIGDEQTRYYSPTDDALYLARLVKHRLPEGVLRLHEGNPAAPTNV